MCLFVFVFILFYLKLYYIFNLFTYVPDNDRVFAELYQLFHLHVIHLDKI